MTVLNLSFDAETTLELTEAQFIELSTTGETVTDFAPAKEYWIEADFSRLFLSIKGSLDDYFFQSDPQEDIDQFVDNAYLTHFFPKTGIIKLIKDLDKPLKILLPGKRGEMPGITQIQKSNLSGEQAIFSDPLNERSVDELVTTGNFKGQISCCACGEEGCSSEYLWAEENDALASFHIVAAGLRAVRLFPFRLV